VDLEEVPQDPRGPRRVEGDVVAEVSAPEPRRVEVRGALEPRALAGEELEEVGERADLLGERRGLDLRLDGLEELGGSFDGGAFGRRVGSVDARPQGEACFEAISSIT
jgi:hypothetical protein